MELRNTKQNLFDEAEHDMMYYQNGGLTNLPKPKAKADKKDTKFDNSCYYTKPN